MSKLRKRIRSRRGFGLTEMLISVMIFGFVSLLACTGLLTALQVTENSRHAADALQLTDTLLSRISEEVRYARRLPLYLADEGRVLAFTNRDGIPVCIHADEDGFLTIHYRAVRNYGEGAQESGWSLKSGDWSYDPASYQGWCIPEDGLRFRTEEKADGSLVLVTDLTLARYENGESQGDGYARTVPTLCFNLSAAEVDAESFPDGEDLINDETYRSVTGGL